MDAKPIVNRVTSLAVLISRESIESSAGMVGAGGGGLVDATEPLVVGVIPKLNFAFAGKPGEDRLEMPVPAADETLHGTFDLRATNIGPGEVWVTVEQKGVRLLKLSLKPQVVERGEPTRERATQEALLPTFPRHWLRIREDVKDNTFTYELTSPSLGKQQIYELPRFKGSREKFVNALYAEIETYWADASDSAGAARAKSFSDKLRARGYALFDELIPPPLQEVLWKHRTEFDSIWVLSEEPFIPWEMVLVHEPGKKLHPDDGAMFLAEMGLVRWLQNVEGWAPAQVRVRANRAFYVIPHYPAGSGHELPEAEDEAKFLEKRLGAQRVKPQPADVLKLINAGGAFDLLHFACHGFAEHRNISNAELMLEGHIDKESGDWEPSRLDASEVEAHARLQDAAGNRPIVIINACQAGRQGYKLTGIGGMAKAFLAGEPGTGAGAGIFVGTLWSVGDAPARTFTETFYSELLAGRTVAQASIAARKAARTAKNRIIDQSTWLAYVVYAHPDAKLTK
jgi:hypothetical protein